MVVEFSVDPDKQLQQIIQKTAQEVEDLSIPFALMTQSWFKSNRAIFALSGAGKYEDLSDVYKPAKQRDVGFVYPILRKSGALEESITKPGDSNSVAVTINKNTLILGSKIPYGPFHQFGTRKMPARPFVLIGAEQVAPEEVNLRRSAWIEILADYVLQKASQIGTVDA